MIELDYTFEGEIWIWDAAKDTWTFVTLPKEAAEEIKFFHSGKGKPRRGFGSIRVVVTCGDSKWRTSIFPDSRSGSYVLPVKAAIRKAEGVTVGDSVKLRVRVVDDPV